jgi:hypothetical protein
VGTKHGKQHQLQSAFNDVLGAVLHTPPGLDTDQFGSFSGEVPRAGTAIAAAGAKARLAMAVSGLPYGLASEASYGPLNGGWSGHEELLLFCDERRGIEVLEGHRTLAVPGIAQPVRDCGEVRPALLGDLRGRNYDAVYLGYGADGHIGKLNLTAQAYAVLGRDRNSFFTSKAANIRSFFFAAEPSIDTDWARFRVSALYASGDGNPYDNIEEGFDAIFENPVFAGADTSYWIRQTVPFAGGGRAVSIN